MPVMLDPNNYATCPACGEGNHKRSILCKFCGETLMKNLPRTQVSEKDMVFLLHICMSRAMFGSDPAKEKSYLEGKLQLGFDQVLSEELGAVAGRMGSFDEALYYYQIAASCEPWLSLTKPAEFEQKIALLEKYKGSRKRLDAGELQGAFPMPMLDERRFRFMLENLRGPGKEEMAGIVQLMEAFEKKTWK